MDESRAIKLCMFRPKVLDHTRHMEKDMTAEEIALRREFIKKMLWKVNPWGQLTDEQLDDVRIRKESDGWYIEDRDLYEYKF